MTCFDADDLCTLYRAYFAMGRKFDFFSFTSQDPRARILTKFSGMMHSDTRKLVAKFGMLPR